MEFKAGLFQQQTMKLAMTQELTQAIALLQFSTQELTAFLEEKALENPLLQLESEIVKPMNPVRERTRKIVNSEARDQTKWLEQMGELEYTLEEHLISQIQTKKLTPRKKKILTRLIESLDENGYLVTSPTEIAAALHTECAEIEECLTAIHCLEPAGIGARSLQECLLIQLEHLDEPNELAETIIAHHFIPFAEKKWKELSKELGITMKQIQDVFDTVQHLNPRPAALYKKEKPSFIVPDVLITKTGEQWTVSVYDEVLPKVSFNQSYYKKLSSSEDQQVNRYLQDKFQDYQWIYKSLEQRRETLLKVVTKIVEKQNEFLTRGHDYLKPMTMKELASELDIHESTVSRAVREKYVQTPNGMFELRRFFTSTIATISDENTSSAQVKNEMQKLIDHENKQKPLSDQDLVKILESREGIVVSRRTVAKYRDQLGIPSSSKRKRYE